MAYCMFVIWNAKGESCEGEMCGILWNVPKRNFRIFCCPLAHYFLESSFAEWGLSTDSIRLNKCVYAILNHSEI